MATGVEELLDMLFEMIDEAKSMPLSSDKCILERDKALDLLDEIRAQFPMELAEAKKLIAARTEYIASAKREADSLRQQAEDYDEIKKSRARFRALAGGGAPAGRQPYDVEAE